MTVLLAFDTAGERMTIALANRDRRWSRAAAGGARASAALVPEILGLLAEAGLRLRDLDAIACGRGPGASDIRVWAAIDARMNQIYAAEYRFADDRWITITAPMLTDCVALGARWRDAPPQAVAGDALPAFGVQLETGAVRRFPAARASAEALLALAERAWRDGAAVDPAQALPLYVRDKVAQTTREREAARSAQGAGAVRP